MARTIPAWPENERSVTRLRERIVGEGGTLTMELHPADPYDGLPMVVAHLVARLPGKQALGVGVRVPVAPRYSLDRKGLSDACWRLDLELDKWFIPTRDLDQESDGVIAAAM